MSSQLRNPFLFSFPKKFPTLGTHCLISLSLLNAPLFTHCESSWARISSRDEGASKTVFQLTILSRFTISMNENVTWIRYFQVWAGESSLLTLSRLLAWSFHGISQNANAALAAAGRILLKCDHEMMRMEWVSKLRCFLSTEYASSWIIISLLKPPSFCSFTFSFSPSVVMTQRK